MIEIEELGDYSNDVDNGFVDGIALLKIEFDREDSSSYMVVYYCLLVLNGK